MDSGPLSSTSGFGKRRASRLHPEPGDVFRKLGTTASLGLFLIFCCALTAIVMQSPLKAKASPKYWFSWVVVGLKYPIAANCGPNTPTSFDWLQLLGLQAFTKTRACCQSSRCTEM